MPFSRIKSHAKLNLALNVISKSKSLHNIESIISFVDLHDIILIKEIKSKKHLISFNGKFSRRIGKKNTVSKLFEILEKKKILKNQRFQIKIKKSIPDKAGLGGGSMNAASILNFFIKKKLIKIKKKEIIELSKTIGSDVILGLYLKNLVLKGNGAIKTISSSRKFYTLLVKPSFGCSTKKIYSKVKKFHKPEFTSISNNYMSVDYLSNKKNDLELIAIESYPRLKSLKNFLVKLPNAKFVRMTGSGSTMIAYFNSSESCKEAAKKVKKQFRNYWCKTSKTI